MKTSPRQSLGRLGEDLAAQYLAEQGFAILARNVRTPYGEIDLLAQQGDLVVFVEVKTRRTPTFGPPEVSITPRKQAHILASAQHYMQAHPELAGEWRIDALSIQFLKAGDLPQITHFQNAFS
ncbi:MAG TPA: YraN family protein [Anaerolineales bacterium]|nr:YraN family protein [Anaerolineales bacterium]